MTYKFVKAKRRTKKGRFTSLRSRIRVFFNRLAILGIIGVAGAGIYAYSSDNTAKADEQTINRLQKISEQYQQEKSEQAYKKERGTLQTILDVCKEENFNPEIAVKVSACESTLNPYAIHVNRDGSIDRGLLQLNSRYYKRISNECAFSAECSTKVFINEVRAGRAKNWRCYSKVGY